MRILICTDGTENSAGIIKDLRDSGLGNDCTLDILAVSEPFDVGNDRPISSECADMLATEIRSVFPDWKVSARTATGMASREILTIAEEIGADLIIIGEPADDPDRQHIFLGQTSGAVVNKARCSVRVARALNAAAASKVVVAFDGSKASVDAIEQVADRSWRSGTVVKIVVVADSFLLDLVGRFAPQMNNMVVETQLVSQWASTLAASAIKQLRAVGVDVSIDVMTGRPQSAIIAAAEQFGATCIFVGPHNDPDSFARFVVGSVSASVAKHADCSVEIVRKK
ncbi:MAG TPA: universal stress protein [Pyrinomonadaceae bacterium]|nr:universal stress protein [Pyrinomonadaceae bacterium]